MADRVLLALIVGSVVFLGHRAGAQDVVAQTPASRLDTLSIVLDGALDEPAWLQAAPITTFVQRDPLEGAPATMRTEARVAFDATAIYVAVRAFDSEPDRIIGFLTRRDAASSSDWLHVLIDSYHDRRTAYQFSVNPVGVKQDSYWYNDNNNDQSWDAVWDVVSRRDGEGWCAEFRIPYSQLRFSDRSGHLGFAVMRHVARLNETSTWPLLSKDASGFVSSFGELTGVNIGQASKRLELVPYVLGQIATSPREIGNPLQQSPDPGSSVGVDLKYAVTPALTLTGTVNPDFGQVEADPAVVNLGAFETFFSERRPFFVEGSGIFQFHCRDACNLFYSRRIGRTPRGEPTLGADEHIAQPLQSTILGAAKLTGRVRSFSVGVLAAATQEERAEIAFGDARRREIVEPGTFYSVSRARREFADQSSLGFMLTTTRRSLARTVDFLPDSAVTGGVDYDWRIGEKWGMNGYWAGSTLSGSAAAIDELQRNNVHSYQRPDAEHVAIDPAAETLRGHSGQISFGKIAGERTRMNVNVAYKSPGFDVNDLGFQLRADEIPQNSWLQIKWEKPGKYTRNIRINFNQWSAFNFDGDRLQLGGNFNGHWQFQNFWSAGFGVNVNARNFDDRLTRGGPGGLTEAGHNSWQYFNTDDRRVVSFNWNSGFGGGGKGRFFELEPRIVVRPISSLSTELGIAYSNSINDAQWVESVADGDVTHYVFGRLEQETASMTVRVNYTVTPNLSLQIYGQPFVSSGRYVAYKELVNGRAPVYEDRYAPYAYADNADFSVLSFRTTNVIRWEYRPGSALFIVWQQAREGTGVPRRFAFGRDYADVFDTAASNTLLVKFAYWLNP